MSDEFDDVIDSTPTDDISADATDTDSAEPVDIGGLMDAADAEPTQTLDAAAMDSGFEAEPPAPEATDVGDLMDAADTPTAQDASFDALDASDLAPSDVTSDTEDLEMDAGSDIANLMDEAAMEEWDAPVQDAEESPADTDVTALMDEGETEELPKDTPDTPLEAEKSAYDELADYYSSHNYGQQHFSEYSKDPQWQELNNAYLQELGYDPIDYGNDEALNINDIHDELVASGIPEDSPELAAILANEQAGIDALNHDKADESDTKDMNDLPTETSLEQSDADVYQAKPLAEIPVLQEDGSVKSLKDIMDEAEADEPVSDTGEANADTSSDGEVPEDIGEENSGELPELPQSKEPDGDVLQEKMDQIVENPELAPETKVAELEAMKDELLNAKAETDAQSIADVNPQAAADSVEALPEIPQLGDIDGWIEQINPNYDPFDWQSPYSNNCGSCAFAVEQRLDGDTDISATSENIGSIEEMNKATGMEQVAMSPDEIRDYLISQGPGSHGIVGIDRVSGPGHWFNAYYDGKKVVAIDGQTGEINDWPPDYGDVTNWDISVRKE